MYHLLGKERHSLSKKDRNILPSVSYGYSSMKLEINLTDKQGLSSHIEVSTVMEREAIQGRVFKEQIYKYNMSYNVRDAAMLVLTGKSIAHDGLC